MENEEDLANLVGSMKEIMNHLNTWQMRLDTDIASSRRSLKRQLDLGAAGYAGRGNKRARVAAQGPSMEDLNSEHQAIGVVLQWMAQVLSILSENMQ